MIIFIICVVFTLSLFKFFTLDKVEDSSFSAIDDIPPSRLSVDEELSKIQNEYDNANRIRVKISNNDTAIANLISSLPDTPITLPDNEINVYDTEMLCTNKDTEDEDDYLEDIEVEDFSDNLDFSESSVDMSSIDFDNI